MNRFWYILGLIACLTLFTTGCRKDSLSEIKLNTPYRANLWGKETNYPQDSINELNIVYILTNLKKDMVVFDGTNILEIINDSVFGELKIPDSDYMFDPYLFGTIEHHSKGIIIKGTYAALKDSVSAIAGEFEIKPE